MSLYIKNEFVYKKISLAKLVFVVNWKICFIEHVLHRTISIWLSKPESKHIVLQACSYQYYHPYSRIPDQPSQKGTRSRAIKLFICKYSDGSHANFDQRYGCQHGEIVLINDHVHTSFVFQPIALCTKIWQCDELLVLGNLRQKPVMFKLRKLKDPVRRIHRLFGIWQNNANSDDW